MKKTLLFSLAMLPIVNGMAQEQEKKPNIILFLVDDMGWQDTSLPFWNQKTMYNERYETPNMERLARQGMMFTQAYACSISSPTRCSLMTGCNAARHRVTNWTLEKDKSTDGETEVLNLPVWNINGIAQVPGTEHTFVGTSFVELLRENGYHTIHCGKAHWGAIDTPGENPCHFGFETNICGHAAGGLATYLSERNYGHDEKGNPTSLMAIPGLEHYWQTGTFATEALTQEALKALDKAKAYNQPFYLYMSHYAIHAPWEPDTRFLDKYLNMGISEFQAKYASMLESMDKSLGDIMALVRRLGIENNTILIFMSDNGQPKQSVSNTPLRGHKISPYEGGIRVPMIVEIPRVTKGGSVCNCPVIIEDIFPTILSLAHASAYKDVYTCDGIDITPFFRGEYIKGYENREFYWHFPHIYDQYPYSVIRKGDYKLIYRYDTQSIELYNIAKDISESQNLADRESKIRKELLYLLKKQIKSTHADIPISKKTGQEVEIVDR